MAVKSFAGPQRSSHSEVALGGPGHDALRVAELLRRGTDANSHGIASPAAAVRHDSFKGIMMSGRERADCKLIRTLPATPTWSEANVQSIMQARIDVLAERISVALAGLQSQADNERRNVEHDLERLEVRVESRVAGLEARLDVASEQVTRNEIKERDLAARVTAIQEEAQKAAETSESVRAREAECERRVREAECRLTDTEDLFRRAVARLQKLEHTAEERDRRLKRVEDQLQQAISQPLNVVDEPMPRLEALEAQVACLGKQQGADQSAITGKDGQWAAALESSVQRVQIDLQDLVCRFEEQSNDLRARLEEHAQESTEACVQTTSAIGAHREQVARLDDLDVRLGSVKIKVDSHENRLQVVGERIDSVCAPLQEGLRQRLDKNREEIVREVECALEVLNQKIDQTRELVEEVHDHPGPLANLGRVAARGFKEDKGSVGHRGENANGGLTSWHSTTC